MLLVQVQLTAQQVLHAFHRDEPYLFLGAAFSTVAFISAALCFFRRRFDALLICLAAFAFLYGQRLWLDSHILLLTLPNNETLDRLQAVVDYLVPIPAFLFFNVAGFTGFRGKRWIWAPIAIFSFLVVATAIIGQRLIFHEINEIVIIATLFAVLALSIFRPLPAGESFALRAGLACFVSVALLDNLVGDWLPFKIEPYGFAVFLISLGYVAARRTFQQEEELSALQQELDLARSIQLSILPDAFPETGAFRVAACYVPMLAVAGDFYDFLVTEDREAALFIADVTGHGVAAALIASMVKMAALSQREHAADPGRVLTAMNAALCGHTRDQYVTAACLHLDAVSGSMHCSAAGHPPMLLLRDGTVSEISENGLILAAHPDAAFTTATHPLRFGDRILLYTDGLVEAADAHGEMFGDTRLASALQKTASLASPAAADYLLAAVQGWSPEQNDDLTLVLCDFSVKEARPVGR